jgi:Uma2 family endonuclease
MQVQIQQHYYTPTEYLALEENAKYRSEYHNGEIIAMTGGTINHNRIVRNFSVALGLSLQKQQNHDHEFFMGDVKVWIPDTQYFFYPDVMVIAGQPQYYENRKDAIINPLVIVEVLSESTQNYDKGTKFNYYRTLPSFQEYILINQYEHHVEQYTKISEYEWHIFYKKGSNAVLELASFPFKVSLLDIYDRVDFD